jgi:hypothetical protein
MKTQAGQRGEEKVFQQADEDPSEEWRGGTKRVKGSDYRK